MFFKKKQPKETSAPDQYEAILQRMFDDVGFPIDSQNLAVCADIYREFDANGSGAALERMYRDGPLLYKDLGMAFSLFGGWLVSDGILKQDDIHELTVHCVEKSHEL